MSLITNRIKGWWEVETLACAGASAGLFVMWLGIHVCLRKSMANIQTYVIYGLLIVATTLLYGMLKGQRNPEVSALSRNDGWSSAVGQTLAVAFVLMTYLAATQDSGISRAFLFSFLPALFVLMILVRRVTFKWLGPYVYSRRHRCGTLLVGDSDTIRKTRSWLASKSRYGLDVIGCLTDRGDDVNDDEAGLPRLGRVRHLSEVLRLTNANVVLVTDLIKIRSNLSWLRTVCENHGARLIFGIDLGGVSAGVISCHQEDGFNLVTIRHEPLESPMNRLLKRGLDVAIALPVVCVVLPAIAIVVWLVHRIQSPGPLMFVQERGGRHGETFNIYKFRTMHVDNDDEARPAVADDGRVFPAARWLRRLSLDEFPQFLNVLEGSMSIVGPRPHMVVHDDKFASLAAPYRIRAFVKPGITGLAQVRGYRGPAPNTEDVLGRTRFDIYYLEHWSLRMDLVIILRTVISMFYSKGAV